MSTTLHHSRVNKQTQKPINMKKLSYEAPVCECTLMEFENTLLSGSALGAPGQSGDDLEILPGLDLFY